MTYGSSEQNWDERRTDEANWIEKSFDKCGVYARSELTDFRN